MDRRPRASLPRSTPRLVAVGAILLACLPPAATLHAAQDDVVRQVRVPQLVDGTLSAAKQVLVRMGLQVGREIPVSSRANPGTVVRQSIAAGTLVPINTRIDLYYAASGTFDGPGPGPVVDSTSVPDLTGATRTSAVIALALVRLTLGAVDSAPDPANRGKVIRQNPPAGTRVPRDSRVAVWLGYAPLVAVPDLRGSTIDAARGELERVGLGLGRIDTTRAPAGAGLIVTQRPGPGTPITQGSSVRVGIEVGPPVRVPSLAGLTTEEAVREIEAAGLRVGVVDSVPSDTGVGTVGKQDPAAGSMAWPDARVGFQVRTQAKLTTVPPVVDSPLAAAVRVLEGAGLRLGRVDTVPRPAGTGLIRRQSPRAGSRVPRGSAVGVQIQIADTAIVDSTRGDTAIRDPVPNPPVPPTPGPATVTMPGVQDSTLDGARRVLLAAGFQEIRVTPVTRAEGVGRVISQQPGAGAVFLAPVPVALLVAVAQAPPAGGPRERGSLPWLWIGAGVAAVGAVTLLLRRPRPGKKDGKPRREPEVTFGTGSRVGWERAGPGEDPIEGPELRLVPGSVEPASTFVGEP